MENDVAGSVARLKTRAEFLRVAATRRKWVAPGLILQIRRSEPDAAIRVGFTCSRKVGNSVKRNRARRRLREAVARILPQHALPGHEFVVIGRQATLERPFDALKSDLEAGLKRLGAWRDSKEPETTR